MEDDFGDEVNQRSQGINFVDWIHEQSLKQESCLSTVFKDINEVKFKE